MLPVLHFLVQIDLLHEICEYMEKVLDRGTTGTWG
jgi:hypothetical protein